MTSVSITHSSIWCYEPQTRKISEPSAWGHMRRSIPHKSSFRWRHYLMSSDHCSKAGHHHIVCSSITDSNDLEEPEDESLKEPSKSENGGAIRDSFRDNLERTAGVDDSKFNGADLGTLIRNKYGRSSDVQLIKKEFMGKNFLAMNVMGKYREQMTGRGRMRCGSSGASGLRAHEEEKEIEPPPPPPPVDDDDSDHDEEPPPPPVLDDLPPQYDEYGRMILHPEEGYWFFDDLVIRGVTKSYKSNFLGEIPTAWTYASRPQRDAWFNNFRQKHVWPPEFDVIARKSYEKVATRRYRDVIHRIIRRHKEPENMKGAAYDGLIKYTKSETFKKRSKQASLNKKGGKPDGKVEPTHFSGSRSFISKLFGKGKKGSKAPLLITAPELFRDTHSRVDANGTRSWTKQRDKELYESYERAKAADQGRDDNEIWFELVDGFQKGNCYGTGSAKHIFFQDSGRKSTSAVPSNTYVPGPLSQLQHELGVRDARDAERDEAIREMQERLTMFASQFPSCNP